MSYEHLVQLLDGAESEADESGQTARYYEQKAAKKEAAEAIREAWKESRLKQRHLGSPDWAFWSWMAAPTVNLETLPDYALFIQFRFRLAGAYLSKDERAFYLMDNPLRRDRLSQLPYVAPTGWKGSLRAALHQLQYNAAHPAVQRLLGNAKGEAEDFAAGRLQFYPSFFTKQGVEIINPHDRKRKVGKNPILMECVPTGAESVFSLLYFPLVQWQHQDDEELLAGVAEDWEVLAAGLPALFCTYGFGAKTGSGHGIAQEKFAIDKHKKRDCQPGGSMVAKFVPEGEPLVVRQFEESFGAMDEWSATEWQEVLKPTELEQYQITLAARERQAQIKAAGKMESELETFADLQQTLNAWAAEIRGLAAAKGDRHD